MIADGALETKSLLVLFFRKEQEDSSFSEEKEAKRLLIAVAPGGAMRFSFGRLARGAGFSSAPGKKTFISSPVPQSRPWPAACCSAEA